MDRLRHILRRSRQERSLAERRRQYEMCTRHRRQEDGIDIVKFYSYRHRHLLEDSDALSGQCVLCNNIGVLQTKIDASYYACAVGDCFWWPRQAILASRHLGYMGLAMQV